MTYIICLIFIALSFALAILSLFLIYQVEDLEKENRELKQIRLKAEIEKTRAEKKSYVLLELFNRIDSLANANTYGNEKAILSKIKELVRNCMVKH